jgi:hypothetical protein
MKLKLVAMIVVCGAVAVACKTSTVDDTSVGGTTSSSTKASSSSKSTSTSTKASSTATGTLACDTGQPGDLSSTATQAEQDICNACIQCAFGDACANDLATFQADPNANAWITCVFGDDMAVPPVMGCPADDPATTTVDEFQQCLDACDTMYPGVDMKYLAVLSCAVCQECPTNCNAAGNCM